VVFEKKYIMRRSSAEWIARNGCALRWCHRGVGSINWGYCGIPWVNCAVLCVKDDWKEQFESCAIACQHCAVWTGAENIAPTGIRFPHFPARSESLYRLWLPGPWWFLDFCNICGLLPYRIQVMHELKEFQVGGGVFVWGILKSSVEKWLPGVGGPASQHTECIRFLTHLFTVIVTRRLNALPGYAFRPWSKPRFKKLKKKILHALRTFPRGNESSLKRRWRKNTAGR
jgi:hypothetical protein